MLAAIQTVDKSTGKKVELDERGTRNGKGEDQAGSATAGSPRRAGAVDEHAGVRNRRELLERRDLAASRKSKIGASRAGASRAPSRRDTSNRSGSAGSRRCARSYTASAARRAKSGGAGHRTDVVEHASRLSRCMRVRPSRNRLFHEAEHWRAK